MSPPLSIIPSVSIPIHAIVLELTINLLSKHRQTDRTIMLTASWSKQTIVDLCTAVVIAVLEAVHATYARGLLVAHSLALLGDVELDAGGGGGAVDGSLLGGEDLLLLLLELGDVVGIKLLLLVLLMLLLRNLVEVHGERVVAACVEDRGWCRSKCLRTTEGAWCLRASWRAAVLAGLEATAVGGRSSRHHCEGIAEIAGLDGEDYHSDPCQS